MILEWRSIFRGLTFIKNLNLISTFWYKTELLTIENGRRINVRKESFEFWIEKKKKEGREGEESARRGKSILFVKRQV